MDVLMATDVVIIEECKQCEQSLTIKKKKQNKKLAEEESAMKGNCMATESVYSNFKRKRNHLKSFPVSLLGPGKGNAVKNQQLICSHVLISG